MATVADIGYGVRIEWQQIDTNASGVAELVDVNGISMTKEAVEATHSNSPSNTTVDDSTQNALVGWNEYIDGMLDAGELDCTLNLNPDTEPPIKYRKSTITVTFPVPAPGTGTAASFTCSAICTAWTMAVPVKGKMTAQCTWKLSGAPTFTKANPVATAS